MNLNYAMPNKYLKICIFLIEIFIILNFYKIIKLKYLELKDGCKQIQLNFNINIKNSLKKKIRLALYAIAIKNGGRSRITSILANKLSFISIFDVFLFTQRKIEENEYNVPKQTKRIITHNNLVKLIEKYKIDLLIYQMSDINEINKLNNLNNNIKVLFYPHTSFFYWIYFNFSYFKDLYKAYRNSKYLIALTHFENDYLFKKWEINSIFMDTFITYEYNNIIPSDLSSKTILMIGRGEDKLKRFELGVKAMKYIIKEIPNSTLKIISSFYGISYLKELAKELQVQNNTIFVGYTSVPEVYFKNASLHIFPSISESFGLVLSETKIYGIPNILIGLDYVSIAKGGTVIIYDDEPKLIAKKSINILKNKKFRKKLGKVARKSMKIFKNDLLFKKWIKLILMIYNDDYYLKMFRNQSNEITKGEATNIINKQLKIIRSIKPELKNITPNKFENFTYLENMNF